MGTAQSKLSDNQRRLVCRLVFLLFCVAPTLGCLYVIWHQPTAADWQQRIQSRLPIKLQIDSVETPYPNQLVLRGVQVVPTDKSLYPELHGFSANEVKIDFGLLANEICFLEPVQIETRVVTQLLQRVLSHMDDRALANERWQISFDKVLLTDSEFQTRDFLLKPLSIAIERTTDVNGTRQGALQARLLARPANHEVDQQISLEFQKQNDQQYVYLDTRSGYLPANLLKHLVAGAPEMGQNSVFQGDAELITDADGRVNGRIGGNILDMGLDKLPDHKNRLVGTCDVLNLICRIENGRIESGQMDVKSRGPISVGRSLFEEARHFGIEARLNPKAPRIRVENLDMGLALQNGVISLAGRKTQIQLAGEWVERECIAHDAAGDPLAICNSPTSLSNSVPLVSLAKILTGQESGNEAFRFLDQFKMQTRQASFTPAGQGLR